MNATYDQAGDFYFDFVQAGLADPLSMFHLSANSILTLLGDVAGQNVCDVACGEGYVSRSLAQRGAGVTGVDLSLNLLAHARRQAGELPICTVQDDAQTLSTQADATFDAAVCSMALMDIPDTEAVFRAVHRVLAPGGRFVFSLLHPCFETPFHVPESHLLLDAAGGFDGFIVRHYLREGHWTSGGTGMRGRFGAHHRTLSTLLNSLLRAGFQIVGVDEPRLPPGEYAQLGRQINSRVLQVLVIAACKHVT